MSTSKKKLTGTQMKSVKAGREITLKKYAAKKTADLGLKVSGKQG